jgi:hypothetical protein
MVARSRIVISADFFLIIKLKIMMFGITTAGYFQFYLVAMNIVESRS